MSDQKLSTPVKVALVVTANPANIGPILAALVRRMNERDRP